ncbi:MAG: hypothetical protein II970_04100 [Paludibacteraceae bacterium]|nr:hypothetical protein [Paludibacteraceae bacterium]
MQNIYVYFDDFRVASPVLMGHHISDWRKWAGHYHIPREEQEQMSAAFKI